MSRTAWIVSGALAALFIVVAVLLVIVIGQNNAAAEQEEHTRVVEICRSQVNDPYGEGLDAMVACMEDLKAR